MDEKMTDLTFRQFVEKTCNDPPPKLRIICGGDFIKDLNRVLDLIEKRKKTKLILLKRRKI